MAMLTGKCARLGLAAALIFNLFAAMEGFCGESAVAKGMRLYREGKYDEALAAFHISKSTDLNKAAYLAWGLSAYKTGKYESAALKFEKVTMMDPGDGDAKVILAECYLRTRRPAQSLTTIRETEKLKVADRGQSFIIWGAAASAAGKGDEALTKYDQALKLRPDLSFDVNMGKGETLAAMGRFVESESFYNAAAKEKPGDPAVAGALGGVLIRSGKYNEAVRVLQGAAKSNPQSVIVQYNLACASARAGKKEQACEAFGKAVSAGFHDFKSALNDEDLASIKDEECFKRVVGGER